jgi:hypothetical protein
LRNSLHAKQQSDQRLNIAALVSGSIWALPMASAELSRRVEEVVGYPPLVRTGALSR